MYWFLAEAPVTLLCICLPACLPLLRRMFSRWVSPVVSKASGYIHSGHSRSNKTTSRSRNMGLGTGEDENAFNIHKYPKDKSKNSSAHTMESGQAFGGRDSPDSDESNRGILPRGTWEMPRGPRTGETSASASAGRRPGEVPDWSIRVDKDVSIHQSKW